MKITLPKIVQKKKTKNSAVFEISPLFPGYGVTIGNSLRRVLLSSLAGCAVDRVRIKGVSHEFSTLKGMKEDVLTFLLNLKNLRLKMQTDEAVLKLEVKGPKEVYAKDIQTPATVEIVNPDLYLATLNKEGKLEALIYVNRGIGYVTQEEKQEEEKIKGVSREIGIILLDSLYTPVKKVNFEIEYTRVGRRTDFEKVILTVETDGTVEPKDAVKQAAKILADHFGVLSDIKKQEEVSVEVEKEKEEKKEDKEEEEIKKRPIAELNLSTRTTNALINNGIKTIGGLLRYSEEKLKELEGLGEKGVQEIMAKLRRLGLVKKEGK